MCSLFGGGGGTKPNQTKQQKKPNNQTPQVQVSAKKAVKVFGLYHLLLGSVL